MMSTSHICTDKILFEVFFGNIEKGLLQKNDDGSFGGDHDDSGDYVRSPDGH